MIEMQKLTKAEAKKIEVLDDDSRELVKVKDFDYWKDQFEFTINSIIDSNEVKMEKKVNEYDSAVDFYKAEEPEEVKFLTCHFIRIAIIDKMTWLHDNDPPTWSDVVQSATNALLFMELCSDEVEARQMAIKLVSFTIQETIWFTRMQEVSEKNFRGLPVLLVDVLKGESYYARSTPFIKDDLKRLLDKS